MWTIEVANRDLFGTKEKNFKNEYIKNYIETNNTGYKLGKLIYHFVAPVRNPDLDNYLDVINERYNMKGIEIFFIQETVEEIVEMCSDYIDDILYKTYLSNHNSTLCRYIDRINNDLIKLI